MASGTDGVHEHVEQGNDGFHQLPHIPSEYFCNDVINNVLVSESRQRMESVPDTHSLMQMAKKQRRQSLTRRPSHFDLQAYKDIQEFMNSGLFPGDEKDPRVTRNWSSCLQNLSQHAGGTHLVRYARSEKMMLGRLEYGRWYSQESAVGLPDEVRCAVYGPAYHYRHTATPAAILYAVMDTVVHGNKGNAKAEEMYPTLWRLNHDPQQVVDEARRDIEPQVENWADCKDYKSLYTKLKPAVMVLVKENVRPGSAFELSDDFLYDYLQAQLFKPELNAKTPRNRTEAMGSVAQSLQAEGDACFKHLANCARSEVGGWMQRLYRHAMRMVDRMKEMSDSRKTKEAIDEDSKQPIKRKPHAAFSTWNNAKGLFLGWVCQEWEHRASMLLEALLRHGVQRYNAKTMPDSPHRVSESMPLVWDGVIGYYRVDRDVLQMAADFVRENTLGGAWKLRIEARPLVAVVASDAVAGEGTGTLTGIHSKRATYIRLLHYDVLNDWDRNNWDPKSKKLNEVHFDNFLRTFCRDTLRYSNADMHELELYIAAEKRHTCRGVAMPEVSTGAPCEESVSEATWPELPWLQEIAATLCKCFYLYGSKVLWVKENNTYQIMTQTDFKTQFAHLTCRYLSRSRAGKAIECTGSAVELWLSNPEKWHLPANLCPRIVRIEKRWAAPTARKPIKYGLSCISERHWVFNEARELAAYYLAESLMYKDLSYDELGHHPDVQFFENFLEKLILEPQICEYNLNWLAHFVQYLGVLPLTFLFLISEFHGVGKNVYTSFIVAMVGFMDCFLTERVASFFAEKGETEGRQARFVVIDEVKPGSLPIGPLNNVVTSPLVPLRVLYQDAKMMPNSMRIVMTTNFYGANMDCPAGRRCVTVMCSNHWHEKTNAENHEQLTKWLSERCGVSGGAFNPSAANPEVICAIYWRLRKRNINDFRPTSIPATRLTQIAKQSNQSPEWQFFFSRSTLTLTLTKVPCSSRYIGVRGGLRGG